jgi:hypothetical protein
MSYLVNENLHFILTEDDNILFDTSLKFVYRRIISFSNLFVICKKKELKSFSTLSIKRDSERRMTPRQKSHHNAESWKTT